MVSIVGFAYFGEEHVLGSITLIARHSEFSLLWLFVRERHDNIEGVSIGSFGKSFFSNYPRSILSFLNFVGLFEHVILIFIGDGGLNLMCVIGKIQEFKIDRARFLD
ncbi:hypothetical protein C496_10811 [Natronorubrum tibetense GA33]|uniref:Uncharacterized protein n=1 Tax=Natronorubrum tibetense GA33 TaxID=1114856 RepID=L9VWZ2_9EURY|nr:hypothetical protein C496_10811 [Natronorubrum tibetense GA33]